MSVTFFFNYFFFLVVKGYSSVEEWRGFYRLDYFTIWLDSDVFFFSI